MSRYTLALVDNSKKTILERGKSYATERAAFNNVIKKAAQIMYRVNPDARWAILDTVEERIKIINPIDSVMGA